MPDTVARELLERIIKDIRGIKVEAKKDFYNLFSRVDIFPGEHLAQPIIKAVCSYAKDFTQLPLNYYYDEETVGEYLNTRAIVIGEKNGEQYVIAKPLITEEQIFTVDDFLNVLLETYHDLSDGICKHYGVMLPELTEEDLTVALNSLFYLKKEQKRKIRR